jgi:hypothetical protein
MTSTMLTYDIGLASTMYVRVWRCLHGSSTNQQRMHCSCLCGLRCRPSAAGSPRCWHGSGRGSGDGGGVITGRGGAGPAPPHAPASSSSASSPSQRPRMPLNLTSCSTCVCTQHGHHRDAMVTTVMPWSPPLPPQRCLPPRPLTSTHSSAMCAWLMSPGPQTCRPFPSSVS